MARIWISALFAVVLALAATPAAQAFSAMAISSDLAFGYCNDRPDEDGAAQCALERCRDYSGNPDRCEIAQQSGATGAYAVAIGKGRWGMGIGATQDEADALAVGYCDASSCEVRARWTEIFAVPELETLPPLDLDDPENTLVLIVMHGSGPEDSPDDCHLDIVDVSQGLSSAVAALEGDTIAGLPVVLDRFCTPHKLGTRQSLKVLLRSGDIEERVNAYREEGVPSEHIFLVGHSAGAWASLLLKEREPGAVNAVIAVAPAFAGETETRGQWWWDERNRQLAELGASEDLSSLVFSFEGDTFETPDAVEPLIEAAGVDFVPVTSDEQSVEGCINPAHAVYMDPCFAQGWGSQIRDYIESRLE